MSRILRVTSFAGLAIGILALIALTSAVFGQPANVQLAALPEVQQTPEPVEAQRVIQVIGEGRVDAQPDQAVVRFGVVTEAETASEALTENSLLMSEVISATQEAGITEEDIQTETIRLEPVFQQPTQEGQTAEVTGYRARNIVSVTVTDLEDLGNLLDEVVAVGGNTIEEIRFEVSNADEFRAEARSRAMESALEKAEQLTDLAGAELGEVVTISEFGVVPPPPRPAEFAAEEAAAGVPIAPGTETIEVLLQVSWTIR